MAELLLFSFVLPGDAQNKVNTDRRSKKTHGTVNNITQWHNHNSPIKVTPLVQFP